MHYGGINITILKETSSFDIFFYVHNSAQVQLKIYPNPEKLLL